MSIPNVILSSIQAKQAEPMLYMDFLNTFA